MKKLLGYVVGLGISAALVIGGISTAASTTKTLFNRTNSSVVYDATGDAINNMLYGFMGTVTGQKTDVNGYLTSAKNDIVDVGSTILSGTSSKSKAKPAVQVEAYTPGQYSNYVEGFH